MIESFFYVIFPKYRNNNKIYIYVVEYCHRRDLKWEEQHKDIATPQLFQSIQLNENIYGYFQSQHTLYYTQLRIFLLKCAFQT